MSNVHNGKRKRSGPAETGTLNKRPKVEKEVPAEPKRNRKRTKGLREQLKSEMEKVLSLSPSPIAHLFGTVNEDGVPHASYDGILPFLKLDLVKVRSLRPDAVVQISNLTSMFAISLTDEGKLMVAHRPVNSPVEERTIYLDNLPEGCNEFRLGRLLRKYGTLVELRIPKTASRKVALPSGCTEMGRRPRPFAFAQFTDKQAVIDIVKHFSHNFVSEDGRPPLRTSAVSPIQLRRKMKILSSRRRRSRLDSLMLFRLRRRLNMLIRREWQLRRKAAKAAGQPLPSLYKLRNGKGSKRSSISPRKRQQKLKSCVAPPRPAASLEDVNSNDSSDSSKQPTDTETAVPVEKKKKKVSFAANEALAVCKKPTPGGKRKRSRNKKRRSDPSYIKGTVAAHFADVQAIPFVRYRELRSQYIALRDAARKEARRKQSTKDKSSRSQVLERDRLWNSAEGSSSAE